VLCAINHKFIVKYIANYMDDKYIVIIMEYKTMRNNNIWNDAFQRENMIWGVEASNVAKIT
jgi:hypothetical protein